MITKQHIKKISEFYSEINKTKETLDNEYVKAREGAEERKVKVERIENNTPKEIETPEANLWYEVQNLGTNCQAGKALKPKYPKVFEAVEKHEKVVGEMNAYCIKEIGIDPLKLSLLDIIRIVEGVIEGKKDNK